MTLMTSKADKELGRLLTRSMFQSLIWGIIAERRRHGSFSLQQLADLLTIDKSAVTRWFKSPPNWRLDTVTDIAMALGVELDVHARDRSTGKVYTATGLAQVTASASQEVRVPHAQDTRTNVIDVNDWKLSESVAA